MSIQQARQLESELKNILNIEKIQKKNEKLLNFFIEKNNLINTKMSDGRTFIHSMARAIDGTPIDNKCYNYSEKIEIKRFGIDLNVLGINREVPYRLKEFLISGDASKDVKKKFRELFMHTYKTAQANGFTPKKIAEKCDENFYDFMNDNGNNGNNGANGANGANGNNVYADNDNNNNNNNNQEFTNFKELYEYYKTNSRLLNEEIEFKVLGKEDNGGNIFKISSSDISLYSNEKKMSNETTLRIEEIEEKPVYIASNFKEIMEENSNELNFKNINFITIKCQCLEDDIEVTSYANETAKHADYKTTTYKKNCDRINIHGDKEDNFNFYYYINSNKQSITLKLVDQNNLNNKIENGGKKSRKSRRLRKIRKPIKSKKSRKSRKHRKSKKQRRSHRR